MVICRNCSYWPLLEVAEEVAGAQEVFAGPNVDGALTRVFDNAENSFRADAAQVKNLAHESAAQAVQEVGVAASVGDFRVAALEKFIA